MVVAADPVYGAGHRLGRVVRPGAAGPSPTGFGYPAPAVAASPDAVQLRHQHALQRRHRDADGGPDTKNTTLLLDLAIRAPQGEHTDKHNQLHPGLPCERASKERMPPILMTALTMAFGMVPPVLAVTEGPVQRAPMDQAVIGRAITSSLPVVYRYLDDFQQRPHKLCKLREPDHAAKASPPS